MRFSDALLLADGFLAPFTLDAFLDRVLPGSYQRIGRSDTVERTGLLGPDPFATLAGAVQLARQLTYHSANPAGPPPSLAGIASADDFRRRIGEFHARRYSVRFPQVRPLSEPLDRLARAFEVVLHVPVTASAFWSRDEMRAPVHHDEHDLLVVQLRGRKRWFVSRKPPELPNPWPAIPGPPAQLGPHDAFEVEPGEIVYLPRGTLHSVESPGESLHVSLGFTPVTVREALAAMVDHLAETDPALRRTVGGRIAFQLRGFGFDQLVPALQDGVARLQAAARSPQFFTAALMQRSSRVVPTLAPLPPNPAPPPLTLDTVLVQRDTAFCHLTANESQIDFSYPGGHVYVTIAAIESLEYIVNTPRFRVRDIAGQCGDDVRLALAQKFVEIGFLVPAAPGLGDLQIAVGAR